MLLVGGFCVACLASGTRASDHGARAGDIPQTAAQQSAPYGEAQSNGIALRVMETWRGLRDFGIASAIEVAIKNSSGKPVRVDRRQFTLQSAGGGESPSLDPHQVALEEFGDLSPSDCRSAPDREKWEQLFNAHALSARVLENGDSVQGLVYFRPVVAKKLILVVSPTEPEDNAPRATLRVMVPQATSDRAGKPAWVEEFLRAPPEGSVKAPPKVSDSSKKTRRPQVRMGATQVSGRLPPEVIQRIVRQNYRRFRMCYEEGLSRNPNLDGRVSVRFIIGRDGSVSNVSNGGSDLPDIAVVSNAYGRWKVDITSEVRTRAKQSEDS
jgi:hypothetical protein